MLAASEVEMKRFSIEKYDALFEAILKLKTLEECHLFFEDIFTVKELEAISQRLEVAAMLREGKNYSEVSRVTGASTATISRVNKCLNYGNGGYDVVLGEKSPEGEN